MLVGVRFCLVIGMRMIVRIMVGVMRMIVNLGSARMGVLMAVVMEVLVAVRV